MSRSAAEETAKKLVRKEHKLSHKLGKHRHTRVLRIAGVLAQAADQPQLITLSAGTLALGLVAGRREIARGGARMLAAHLAATAVKTIIKRGVDRPRPAAAEEKPKRLRDDHDESSFPSGHTAGAVAVARAAARDMPALAVPAALATVAVAAAQPATGAHNLSDVAAGAVIGWVAEAMVSAVFDRIEPKVEAAVRHRLGRRPFES